jgi:hypothetical protein
MTDETPTVTIVSKAPENPPVEPVKTNNIGEYIFNKLDKVEAGISNTIHTVFGWFTIPKGVHVEDPKMIPAPTRAQTWWSHFKSAVAAGLVAFSSFNVGAVLPKIDQAKQAAVEQTAKQAATVNNLKKENTELKEQNAKLVIKNAKPSVFRVEQGVLVIKLADGRFEKRKDGSAGWRYNNPGKIAYGAFAKAHNAIGSDGPLAVFPSYDDGLNALSDLMFGEYSDFKSLTVTAAIRKLAPSGEGYDQHAYAKYVLKFGKYKKDTVLSTMTVDDRVEFLNAIIKYEQFTEGSVKTFPDEASLEKDSN